ncbi:glycoside hydrolase [Mycena metata]|uniref:mannan endo-1,4-beta-mannosidase n=1 Tax=Mycena metata TaxID=1033252 RepID=A0AAD7JYZ6_9AGAR|nr:glycoside hydrolase [Mycena metata]
MIRSTVLVLALVIVSTLAQSPIWGQCGGVSWTGPTSCATGSACVEQSQYYSQCLPGAATTTPAPPTSTPNSPPTSTKTSATSTASVPAQTGFVKTSGTRFTLNGAKYTLFGTNAYWLPLTQYSTADINTAFNDIVTSGATTVRTWGFNEVTAPTTFGAYFHLWSGSTATVNTGATDTVIASAKAHGIRLIISLTNNWSDFGGMDVYTAQILGSGQPHDLFYTNPTIITAFKAYVQAVVTRYVNEPTILLNGLLANEPRCAGSNTVASANCTVATITTWASTISAFIKSIDPNHLVAIGDEGFFNEPGSHNFDFVYQGSLGIDFAANMKIPTIDFGTFHMYPSSWGEAQSTWPAWGSQWITDHATVMTSTNKPVIMEEFGIPSSDQTAAARETIYAGWYQTVLNSSLTGDLIWQAGSQLSNGPTADDGFAIFPTDPVYPLLQSHSAALKARG